MRHYGWLLAGGTVLLLSFQAVDPAKQDPGPGLQESEASPSPLLALRWKRAVGAASSLSISPDGKYTAVVDAQGEARCFGPDGQLAWQASVPKADHLVLGLDGSAIAYALLNPVHTTIHLISNDGKVRSQRRLDGAIWAAAASPESGHFAIGTGQRYCYLYRFSGRKRRYRRWRLPGVPCLISFAPDGQRLIVGTWQESGVGAFTLRGGRVAWYPGQSDRLYRAEVPGQSGYVTVVASPNTTFPIATVHFKNANLDDLWKKDFAAHDLEADVSPAGDYVALGYQRIISHKDEEVRENRIAVYNRGGRTLWEKGGLFGRWNLIEVSPSGNLLVHDESSLYVLSRQGNVLLQRKLPAGVREFARNRDRKSVAVYCGDGQLCVFAVK